MPINPLKEFFKKKKAEVKFARAGPGQKLSDCTTGSTSQPTTSAKEAAAEAAMKRFSKQSNDKPTQRARLVTSSNQPSSDAASSHQLFDSKSGSAAEEQTNKQQTSKELTIVDGVPERNVQIFTYEELAQRIKQPDLDDDFFRLTVEDAKLFKQRYQEEAARNEILKTSEMRRREMEAKRPTTNISRLRFKLPNNQVIEASFSGNESFQAVKVWIEQHCKKLFNLELKSYDILLGVRPIKEADYNKTIKELNLIPATTLTIVGKAS